MLPFQKSCVFYREHDIVYTCTDPQVLDSTELDNKIVSAKNMLYKRIVENLNIIISIIAVPDISHFYNWSRTVQNWQNRLIHN